MHLGARVAQQPTQPGFWRQASGFPAFCQFLRNLRFCGHDQRPNLKVCNTDNPRFLWKLEFNLRVWELGTDWHNEAFPYDPQPATAKAITMLDQEHSIRCCAI